ncbi:HAMP domain-containing sensor histidine kinase [Methylomonas sp. AM2-LC]|uniref:sensor histidine kinase n=1 Tax=Methylomonas sp. AM2-LC TaxID=3153301 RepID=UPI0032645C47
MFSSFRQRIFLTYACLLFLTTGINLLISWNALSACRHKNADRFTSQHSEWVVNGLTLPEQDYTYYFISEISAVLLLMLIVGLVAFSAITHRFQCFYASIKGSATADIAANLYSKNDEIDNLGQCFKQMSEQLAVQRLQLLNQEDQRRQMMINVSHELRTPLTSLQGYLETLLRKNAHLSVTEQWHYLEVAVKQSQRVGQLTQNLFELAKLEADLLLPHFEIFYIQELVQDLAQKFSHLTKTNCELSTTHFMPGNSSVYADIGMIERVISQLLETTLHYTTNASCIHLSVECHNGFVEVAVQSSELDQVGDELLNLLLTDQLWDETQSSHAVALNLWIAKRIMLLHASKIEIGPVGNYINALKFRLPTASEVESKIESTPPGFSDF